MEIFNEGDVVLYYNPCTGMQCTGTYVMRHSSISPGLAYIQPFGGQHIFGPPDRDINGRLCYLLQQSHMTLYSREGMSLVEMKIQSLNARFKAKTLPKTRMQPLALPK